jgi:hypothetical protein
MARNRRAEAGEIGHLERRAGTLRAEAGHPLNARSRSSASASSWPRTPANATRAWPTRTTSRASSCSRRRPSSPSSSRACRRWSATPWWRSASWPPRCARSKTPACATPTRTPCSSAASRRPAGADRSGGQTPRGHHRALKRAAPRWWQRRVGQAVDGTRALLNLVPADAKLEARLYAPSRTVGFVRPGDTVLLRYQSFPFQKFGQPEGVVTSVSNNAVTSTELAGFQIPDVPPGEPVYAIVVRLKAAERHGLRQGLAAVGRHAAGRRHPAGNATPVGMDARAAVQRHGVNVMGGSTLGLA